MKITQFDNSETNISYHDHNGKNGKVKEIHTPNDVCLKYDYDPDGRVAAVHCDGRFDMRYSYDSQGRLLGVLQEG